LIPVDGDGRLAAAFADRELVQGVDIVVQDSYDRGPKSTPPEVRRIVYTSNAIESVHTRLRKIIKARGHFPTDGAATMLLWLALRNITADWSRATREWKSAMNQFANLYADRFKPSTVFVCGSRFPRKIAFVPPWTAGTAVDPSDVTW
jgi:hypothetical protein